MTREQLLQSAKPIIFSTGMVQAILDGRKTQTRRVIKPQPEGYFDPSYCVEREYNGDIIREFIPRYQPDDILYVREAWNEYFDGYAYKADIPTYPRRETWRPSIYMPKEAARLFLRVTAVRAERVQNITADDCAAEGMRIISVSPSDDPDRILDGTGEPCDEILPLCYSELWNDLYRKRDGGRYSWNSNPWVWVIQFERVEITP